MASEVEGDTEETWFAHIVSSKFDVIEHLVEQDDKYK